MQKEAGSLKVRVGILALQGAVKEHADMIKKLDNTEIVLVKKIKELDEIDGLILPGGESTAMGKLLLDYSMIKPITEKAVSGMPMWGTCAGMILMAKQIDSQNKTHLNLLDINVVRNGYGGQLDSFETKMCIPAVSQDEIPLVFIRAPYIKSAGSTVRVLAQLDGKIIAVEEGNLIATSFHPELTKDTSFHQYFLQKIMNWKKINN